MSRRIAANLRRGLGRLLLHGLRLALIPIDALNPRLFMALYLPLLRAHGLTTRGTPRYISPCARFDDLARITLGDRVVISRAVTLLTHDYALTTALRALGQAPPTDIRINRPITVSDNVFIGLGAVLLPGADIGPDVIVGAGAVVRGTIPPDSMVLGNPGRVVGSLTGRKPHWHALRDGPDARADA